MTRRSGIFIFVPIVLLFFFLVGQSIAGNRSSAHAAQAVVTFNPTQDAYISEQFPTTNYGSASLLVGRNASGRFQSLLQFDISSIPSNALVVSATLEVYNEVNRSGTEGLGIDLFADAIYGPWSENSVTWNNAPNALSQGDPPTDFNGFPGWHSFDVSNIVTAWVDGTLTNYGMLLRLDETFTAVYSFHSRESVTTMPRLHVS